jgi:hypothetical protein
MDPDTSREQWLARLEATGRAQSRYLWITLVAGIFFFALRYADPSTREISVPIVDLKLDAAAVLASGGTIIALVVLASLGAILAWSTALREYGGESWRDQAERLDTHPNFLDLAIYTAPGPSTLFGKVVYFVYPFFLTSALVESAWLQWWVWTHEAPARWFFTVTWLLVFLRGAMLIWRVWRERIALSRAQSKAG